MWGCLRTEWEHVVQSQGNHFIPLPFDSATDRKEKPPKPGWTVALEVTLMTLAVILVASIAVITGF
jgi:hypothetical protein